MKASHILTIILTTVLSSTAALGQQDKESRNAVKGYQEIVNKAVQQVKDLHPSKEATDSACYLLGVNYGLMFGNFFDSYSEINFDLLLEGISDGMRNGEPQNPYEEDSEWRSKFKINPYELSTILNNYVSARTEYVAALNAAIGENFLATNAKKEKVMTTESGLQYILHSTGNGPKVTPEDTVVVKYRGYLLDGTEFDANDSAQFGVNGVVEGMTEGLCLLAKGGSATLYIPCELAYGENLPGGVIGPNSLLIFEIEVLDIVK